MRAVAQLRANGVGQDEIIARLRENPTTGQQKPLESPTTGLDAPSRANMYPLPLESLLNASVGKVDAINDKLEAVDRRLERIESRRNTWLLVLAAFVAGVLVVVALVWILSMVR